MKKNLRDFLVDNYGAEKAAEIQESFSYAMQSHLAQAVDSAESILNEVKHIVDILLDEDEG